MEIDKSKLKYDNIKIALIGSTGAIGKEIVKYAMETKYGDQVGEMTLICRRVLDDWKYKAKMQPEGPYATKLKYIVRDNYDNMQELEQ